MIGVAAALPPPPAAAITDEMKAELAKLKDLFDGGLLPEHLYEAKLKMMLGLPSTLPAPTEYKELGVLPRIPSPRFSCWECALWGGGKAGKRASVQASWRRGVGGDTYNSRSTKEHKNRKEHKVKERK